MLSKAGDIQYEVVEEEGTGMPLLYAYIPAELSSSDLEVVQGTAAVSIEHIASDRVLGVIELAGFEISQEPVKFSKKHRRYTIRLLAAAPPPPAAAATAAGHSPAKHQSGVAPPPPSGVGSAAASTGNIFGLLDNDDVSDDDAGAGGEGAAGGAKKKKKKKKKGKKAGAGGEGEGDGEEGSGVLAEAAAEVAAEEAAAAVNGTAPGAAGGSSGDEGTDKAGGGEGATGGAKKKKKKKKKGGAAGSGGNEAEVEAGEAGLPERPASPPPRTLPDSAASGAISRDSRSPSPPAPGNAADSSSSSQPPCGSAPLSKSGSRPLSVSMESDFLPAGGAAFGDFEVGGAVDHDPLLGPAVHNALGKVQVKGEDRWLEAPSNSWSIEGVDGGITAVSAFGIFDGHGGRMAAQHAAKHLLPLVGQFAERALGPEPPASPEQLAADGYLDAGMAAQGPNGSGDYEAALERARVAAAQDALITRLPKALHAGFVQCDEDVNAKYKQSGTTATLAVQVGWELLVANVGDSLAYLDTGTEIVVISGNHRVAENTEEQERIIAAGGRIKPARYDEDEEDGPGGTATPHEGLQLRVWPGGINMTRTIGDEASKGLLIPEPAVRQISLPVTGARLIIASDGLWDAVNAKTVIGQLRTCNAREAASKAAVYAMRNKKHDDDVTVVVADFVPREADTHVPGLLKKTNGPAAAAAAALAAMGMREERAAQSWRPLEAPSDSWRARHRAHRTRAAAYLEQLAAAEAGEEAQVEARQRAVALAAGQQTVAAAAGHRPPVSDTYRELAALKLDVTALDALDAEEDDKVDEDNWTSVDNKKKKDSSGGAAQNMLSALARAAQPGTVKPAPGRGGRDRRDRDRERNAGNHKERDAAAAMAAAAAAAAAAAPPVISAGVPDAAEGGDRRGPRGERRDRRDRGGAGGRGPRGGSAGRPAAEGASPTGAAPAAPEGVVKSGGYLFVPKSLLTGGAGAGAAGADSQGGEGGRARRDRAPRPERGGRGGGGGGRPRDAPPAPTSAPADGGEAAGEGAMEGGAAANGGAPRRDRGPRDRKPRGGPKGGPAPAGEAGASAAAPPAAPAPASYQQPVAAPPAHYAPAPTHQPHHAAPHLQPQGQQHQQHQQAHPQPHTTHVPVASSSDPIVELGGHHRAHHAHHAAPQPHYLAAPAPAPAGPSFAGPMDFGAGFGAGFSAAPGSNLWAGPGAAATPATRAPGGPTSGGGRGRGGAAPGAGRGGQQYRSG
ncbi:hypothetical protein CHLRE_03g201400v5 [Chlamydomonas reinhardtii]|uniref:PPM-type phosphatase domain-containing protein n=1 Tax=Chlamydomonas reinhardtii TaxID=3055 RepID=A0A2K3DZC7_CHLRE|nr:uncharacterized protein CHLRE_03g201400v5 [Chlamydomonas reinhardtii]PNW85883.1 hypothetical protein CHLRE_03g201400v5 [Chlamydomonas reinhardtii]